MLSRVFAGRSADRARSADYGKGARQVKPGGYTALERSRLREGSGDWEKVSLPPGGIEAREAGPEGTPQGRRLGARKAAGRLQRR